MGCCKWGCEKAMKVVQQSLGLGESSTKTRSCPPQPSLCLLQPLAVHLAHPDCCRSEEESCSPSCAAAGLHQAGCRAVLCLPAAGSELQE